MLFGTDYKKIITEETDAMKQEIEIVNVVGYTRTAAADPNGEKLQEQETQIVLYCNKNNLNLVRVFSDNGSSGLNFDRDGWVELKDFIVRSANKIRAVIVYDMARIGRDIFKTAKEIEQLRSASGISILPLSEPASKITITPLLQPKKKPRKTTITGRLVMVHPYLTTDPIEKQGAIGKVIDASGKNKEVLTVEFSDGKRGHYLPDALLTLYPQAVILQGMVSNDDMKAADYKVISKIYQLVLQRKYEAALQMALTSEATKFFCTTTCADWLEMKAEKNRKQDKGKKLR